MRDALVFNGASNLNFQDIRANVIRIPEVVQRIREAQAIWDKLSATPLDLTNFIGSEDETFLGHIKLKSFATAVVQVGLLDRYLKNHKISEYVIGAVNGDSPLLVAIGEMTFEQLVSESLALSPIPRRQPTATTAQTPLGLPILSGVQLVEFAAFKRNPETGKYDRQASTMRELERMIVELVDKDEVNRLIMVGPGSSVSGKRILDLTARDVQVQESIDLDPMLTWFWAKLRDTELAIAN
ncbi:MAG TPA: hypothetical protein PKC28_04105 [Bdellovibrionales bacterium]|nr:hypothetical protein [Bdellovibrionales bacterium]